VNCGNAQDRAKLASEDAALYEFRYFAYRLSYLPRCQILQENSDRK